MYDFDKVIERRNTNSAKWDGEHCKNDPEVLPMWVADMDFETLPEVKEALIKRAQHGIFGYAGVTDDYLQAVIDWMERRHQFHIEKDWIVTTTGVVTALRLAVSTYTKENDNILIMKPVYYPFDFSIKGRNRNVIECPLVLKDDHYECDFELFEQKIIDNDVKMFILCNPHNPIGKVWTKEELKQIGDICKKHDVIVVSDEIHMDFVYEGHTHVPFVEVDESYKDFTIICTAPSKTFNLAALQTSNIIIPNETLREQYKTEKQASGVTDPNIFGMDACKAAYTYGDKWVDELLVYLQGNIDYMIDFFKTRLPEIKVIKPEGLYLIWVDFRALNLEPKDLEDFMLHKVKLWLDEGYIFGTGGEGFERFNVACPRSTLKQALEAIEKAIKENQLL
ncbi:MAG: pyridoxal phosphate-dependent aminotransferase [Erysipelotrichaceae bacterium]|nr:pyridoxal phosphate-dependent aminotransferase [Erysipelotrichaceae bacterium]